MLPLRESRGWTTLQSFREHGEVRIFGIGREYEATLLSLHLDRRLKAPEDPLEKLATILSLRRREGGDRVTALNKFASGRV